MSSGFSARAEAAAPLTEADIRAAVKAIYDAPPIVCGSKEHPHYVHPRAEGWTTCGMCGAPLPVYGGQIDYDRGLKELSPDA